MMALGKIRPEGPNYPGPCPEIETKRLRLRPVRMGDADAIAFSLIDFEVARMLTRVPAPFHRQDAVDWLNGLDSRKSAWPFAITTDDDVMIGNVSLELLHGQWHLGYWLNRFYWGKGLMSEAVEAVLERAFMRMPEVKIHSGAFAENSASLRIQEKLGFAILGCRNVFPLSRNATAPLIETSIDQAGFASRKKV
ncbi:GNAT family N-acetyltransferase [Peteryoungia desertarenae]|uniref:GNAT family N-acetyltransferase n=1 Tax=Peteryoungia desertarenae TaxID=1813451 RepID=A0ABX6QJM7_9HYPH|nr:GNAT family N-acetyltransferase [Peteryoungia desertarenae]QLF68753.1 GNAT family N-acetyltransferase [Peteryoungia desertarenae]